MALVSNSLTLSVNIDSQLSGAYAYFLNSERRVVMFETLEISHPNFSQVYRIVRNSRYGITATLEDLTTVDFTFYPLAITPTGNNITLDQGYRIDLGDPGRTVSDEISNVYIADGQAEKPTLVYRAFRSDDLTQPLIGPETLEIGDISFNREGCTFEARAPRLNILRTGEIYDLIRFPTLKGFLK